MCGISGIVNFSAKEQSVNLRTMNTAIHHRGPDEDGEYIDERVLLGHKRLAIIDIASGQQPMTAEDEKFVIVYNGEVYNFSDIRQDLQREGFSFRTNCDTEVILKAYIQWGPASVKKLRGMFAFAIYDKTKSQMFFARDRLGIKPLFFGRTKADDFVFGSELKALTAHPDFVKKIRLESYEEYLSFGYIPEPNTIYQAAYKLKPGHTLTLDINTGKELHEEYWDLQFKTNHSITESDAITQLGEKLKEAIDIRLVSEVPLGAFLSGGVDSSVVVATMSEIMDKPVNTCSIGFTEKSYDESDYADQVAAQYQTNHLAKTIASDEFAMVDQLVDLYDEPYADSSALPTYRVCQLARQNVTVALSGDGADEALAGYRRYKFQSREDSFRGVLPDSVRKPVFGSLAKIYPKMDWAPRFLRAKSTFESMALDSVSGYFQSVSIVNDSLRQKLFSDNYRNQANGHYAGNVFYELMTKANTDDPLSLIQYLDIKSYLMGDILTKVDRASMAHSLEVRVPFLDHILLEWMATLPKALKLKQGIGKYVLKKSMANKLPHDLLYRQKMGFRIPIAEWFRGPLKNNLTSLSNGAIADTQMFNMKQLNRMIGQHVKGSKDFSAPLWTLYMLEKFLQKHG